MEKALEIILGLFGPFNGTNDPPRPPDAYVRRQQNLTPCPKELKLPPHIECPRYEVTTPDEIQQP